MTLKPGIAELHVLLGDAYIKAGRMEEGISAYKQALSLDPLHSQARYHLAKTYLEMGNKDLALEKYEILMILNEELASELTSLIFEGGHNTQPAQ
jgi:tetratricopeptide (TPR) repeat protein